MTPEDLSAVEALAATLRKPVDIRLGVSSDHRAEPMEAFLKALTASSAHIRYRREDLPEGSLPAIRLPGGVEFLSVPAGVELPPFLSLLVLTADGRLWEDPLVNPHRTGIEAIAAPCPIRLHIARHCPHCPKTVTQWSRIAAASRHIRLSVIESDLFPELARSDNVRSVPTLVFDDALRWSGTARPEDVLPVLANQDPAGLDASALESLIRDGQAGDLASTMQRRQLLFPAIFELLTHPKWPVRLGAMVVMETLAETDPTLAAGAVAPLVRAFEGLDTQTRGDVLYIIGETGGGKALPFIQKAAAEAVSDELRAAAEEAIHRIRQRMAGDREKAP